MEYPNPEVVFGSNSPCEYYSEERGCSMSPYCDWGSDCQGIHSFSGHHFGDSTVDGPENDSETLKGDIVVDQPAAMKLEEKKGVLPEKTPEGVVSAQSPKEEGVGDGDVSGGH